MASAQILKAINKKVKKIKNKVIAMVTRITAK